MVGGQKDRLLDRLTDRQIERQIVRQIVSHKRMTGTEMDKCMCKYIDRLITTQVDGYIDIRIHKYIYKLLYIACRQTGALSLSSQVAG